MKLDKSCTHDEEETPELLAAIDEADVSPETGDITAKEISANVRRWSIT